MSYYPVNSQDSLSFGRGENLVVVTGWTPVERLKSKLPIDCYAAMGNLYSKDVGINLLLRNLIANPQIKYVIGLRCTKNDYFIRSVDYLESFFVEGYNKRAGDFDSNPSYISLKDSDLKPVVIDLQIPDLYLDRVRKRCQFLAYDRLDLAVAKITSLASDFKKNDPEKECFHSDFRMKFDTEVVESVNFPSLNDANIHRSDRLLTCWLELNQFLLNSGYKTHSRHGFSQLESATTVSVIEAGTALSYLDSDLDLEVLPNDKRSCQEYCFRFLDSKKKGDRMEENDDKNQSYDYPDRIYNHFGSNQYDRLLNSLKENPYSPAVINIWDNNLDAISQQPPCLNHLAFYIENRQLHLTATFRSHDIFRAWYPNSMALILLQKKATESIARELKVGKLTIISQRGHIYDYDLNSSLNAIKRGKAVINRKEFAADPCGNFIIKIISQYGDRASIEVTWIYEGKIIARYLGRKAKKLCQDIFQDTVNLKTEHIFYLGSELEKAAIALELGIEYRQDKPLNLSNLKKNFTVLKNQ